MLKFVLFSLIIGLSLPSCSGQADKKTDSTTSDSTSVNGSVPTEEIMNVQSIDELHAQIKELVLKGDLEANELEDAIELIGKFYKAYTPIAVEMAKKGSKRVDIYEFKEDKYPYVTYLLNKRIYKVTSKRKNRKELEDKIQKSFDDLNKAISDVENQR